MKKDQIGCGSKLKLSISALTGKAYAGFVKKHLLEAHGMLRPALRELSVAFVGDKRMGELHEEFMSVAGPTDVLTFPMEEDGRGRVTAGEVVICIPEARRRAKEGKIPVAHEVLLYALHGMLHLCGFDDIKKADFRKMHRTEDDLLTRLGVGRVFEAEQVGKVLNKGKSTRRRGGNGVK